MTCRRASASADASAEARYHRNNHQWESNVVFINQNMANTSDTVLLGAGLVLFWTGVFRCEDNICLTWLQVPHSPEKMHIAHVAQVDDA